MSYGIYPGSTPEFRTVKRDGVVVMQVRYVHRVMGYTGKWMDVPQEEVADERT